MTTTTASVTFETIPGGRGGEYSHVELVSRDGRRLGLMQKFPGTPRHPSPWRAWRLHDDGRTFLGAFADHEGMEAVDGRAAAVRAILEAAD